MIARVMYLRQMLQQIVAEGAARLLIDFNLNSYRPSDLLNSGNNALLNSLVYFEPESKEIISVDQPGEFQPFPIGSFVTATGGFYHNGPKAVPPTVNKGAVPSSKFLYKFQS